MFYFFGLFAFGYRVSLSSRLQNIGSFFHILCRCVWFCRGITPTGLLNSVCFCVKCPCLHMFIVNELICNGAHFLCNFSHSFCFICPSCKNWTLYESAAIIRFSYDLKICFHLLISFYFIEFFYSLNYRLSTTHNTNKNCRKCQRIFSAMPTNVYQEKHTTLWEIEINGYKERANGWIIVE